MKLKKDEALLRKFCQYLKENPMPDCTDEMRINYFLDNRDYHENPLDGIDYIKNIACANCRYMENDGETPPCTTCDITYSEFIPYK